MTSKEKAKELVDKYFQPELSHFLFGVLDFETSKESALICVEEIIENRDAEQLPISYWKQVKKEIEQL